MRVLYVTAEVYPLIKTGGLADVSAALPAALRECGIDVRILVPGYPQALERATHPREILRLGNLLGAGETRILETVLPDTRTPVWLVDCPHLYNRAGGPYRSEQGVEWPDNALRFAVLNYAAAAIAGGAVDGWSPDIVHANDWHAGLIPLLILRQAGPRPHTVLTIHNLAYQGLFAPEDFGRLGLAAERFTDMEFYGRISFLKAGIAHADALTTVSPTYAREILTPEQGCGMDGLLGEKAGRLAGILNGVDYRIWDPRFDPYLDANYSARMLAPKLVCKRAILAAFGLDADEEAPLMAFTSRLVHQKMPEAVLEALPSLVEGGLRFALAAEGDASYGAAFRALGERFPGRVAVRTGYQEPLAHRLLAGADMLAHPARFEPCGLMPMYGLRYGAIPIVRRTGGMADTVTDATPETMRNGTATGFVFEEASSGAFLGAARRAVSLYRQPLAWRKIQGNAMSRDFSWARSAERYAQLYRSFRGQPLTAPEPRVAGGTS